MVRRALRTDWTNGELVSADDMNAIGESLATLRSSGKAIAAYTTTANIIGNAAQYTDVDSENLNLTITTTGGDVLAHFQGTVTNHFSSGTYEGYFDVTVDGNRQGGEWGLIGYKIEEDNSCVSFTYLIQNLSEGPHTFKLQWRESGSGSQSIKLRPYAQFWVREI